MRRRKTCCVAPKCRSRSIAPWAVWLSARGFAVLVPERPGHGATGGRYLEDQGGCDEADYAKAGRATADSIAAALDFMRGQSLVRPDGVVIVGHSAGVWGALALAGQNPHALAAIVAFAPGRGGHANDLPNRVCAPHTLISAAAEFGKSARVPVTWLVAANDTYFAPALSRQMADAFRAGGQKRGVSRARLHPAAKATGCRRPEGGVKIAAPELAARAEGAEPGRGKKAMTLVIASGAKQSRKLQARLDCFVATLLAMTRSMERRQ